MASATKLLHRGRQCLFIGFFTCWLGVGLLFIIAACVIGLIGLCGDRPGNSLVLVLSSIVAGFIAVFVVMHLLAVAGIIAFSQIKETRDQTPPPKPTTQPASKTRK